MKLSDEAERAFKRRIAETNFEIPTGETLIAPEESTRNDTRRPWEEVEADFKQRIQAGGSWQPPMLLPDTSPTEATRQYRLSQQTGLAPETVWNDPAEAEKLRRTQTYQDSIFGLEKKAPRLSMMLNDPVRGPALADDVETLSGMEQTWRVITGAPGRLAAGATAAISGLSSGAATAVDLGQDFLRFERTLVNQPWYRSLVGLDELAPVGDSELAAQLDANAALLGQYAESFRGDREGLGPTAQSALSGVESITQSVIGLAASVATGSPAPMLALMGATAGGTAAGRAREKGLPTWQQMAYGLSDAGAEVFGELVPAMHLLGSLKIGSTFAKALVGQMVREIPGEQATELTQSYNEWMYLNPEGTLGEWLEARPSAAWQTLVATVVSTGGTTAAAYTPRAVRSLLGGGKRDRSSDLARDALYRRLLQLEGQTTVSSIVEQARSSALLGRDSELFTEVTSSMLEDGVAYIDAAQAQTFFQSNPEAQAAFFQAVPEAREQLGEALDLGGDLVVPLSKVVTELAKNPTLEGLQELVRLAPEALTDEAYRDVLLSEIGPAAASNEQRAAIQVRADAIEERLAGEIQVAGHTRSTSRMYAQVFRAYYEALRPRLEGNAEQIAKLEESFDRLRVQRGGAAAEEGSTFTQVPFPEDFTGSVVRGQAYHGTYAPSIERWNTHGFSAHFGSTPEQANTRIGDVVRIKRGLPHGTPVETPDANILPVYLDLKNPLRMQDTQWNNSVQVADVLAEMAAAGKLDLSVEDLMDISDEATRAQEHEAVYGTVRADIEGMPPEEDDWTVSKENIRLLDELKSMLEFAGYDGIVYRNEFEGEGDSYIVFNPEQIISAVSGKSFAQAQPDGSNTQQVGSRAPTAVAATETPLDDLRTDLETAERDPAALAKNISAILRHSYIRGDDVESVIQHMVDNLIFLYDLVPEAIRAQSRRWYKGANKIAHRLGSRYGIEDHAAAGMLAALSPQTDWNVNVSRFERVLDIMTRQQNTDWSYRMGRVAGARIRAVEARVRKSPTRRAVENLRVLKRLRDETRGKKLSELPTTMHKAFWLRAYDEAHNPRRYRDISPDGEFRSWMRTGGGALQRVTWGPDMFTARAISVFENPDLETISNALGTQHKVRSFYNNILAPDSPRGDVTVDTHAVAAAHLLPLGPNYTLVLQSFGKGVVNSSISGMQGTNVFYAEAYRRAAELRGTFPREMQSVTWELARDIMPRAIKRAQKRSGTINAVWARYKRGEIDGDQARAEVLRILGGYRAPSWSRERPGAAVNALHPDTTYQDQLPTIPKNVRRGRPGSGGPGVQFQQSGRGPGDGFGPGTEGERAKRLDAPPIRDDGRIALVHWSGVPGIQTLDPAKHGTAAAGAERARKLADPENWVDRNYYGIGVGQPGGYVKETQLGQERYQASLPADRLYDFAADPLGLRAKAAGQSTGWDNETSVLERLVRDAGYAGYWVNRPGMGLVAAVYEPLSVEVPEADIPQDVPLITVEAIPAVDTGVFPEIQQASDAAKLAYTQQAFDLITAADGSNELLNLLGVEGTVRAGHGTFEGDMSPNFIVQVPDAQSADLASLALAYIYSQKAVPWFALGAKGAEGVKVNFRETPDAATLTEMMKVGDYTRVGNALLFVNFEGEAGFIARIQAAVAAYKGSGAGLIAGTENVYAAGEYHAADWTQPATVLADLQQRIVGAGGTPELMEWLNDRRAAVDKLQAEFKPEIRRFEQNVQSGQRRAGSPENAQQTVAGESPALGWAGATRIRRGGVPARVFRASRFGLRAENWSQLGAATAHPSSGLGIWFTTRESDARSYGPTVEPFYLDIRNPFVAGVADMPAFKSVEDAVAFRERLQAQGYDAFIMDSREVGGPIHIATFEPAQVIRTETQLSQEGDTPRARITFGDQHTLLELMEGNDLSSIIHEGGHFFLETYRVLATMPESSPELQQDWGVLLDWLGSTDGTITTEMHEKFARGFELYAREGRAPSAGLRRIFRTFKSWLVQIYKDATELDVELTDDVRAVFDRMLASSEEIEAMKDNPLLTPNEGVLALLTKAERDDYLRRLEQQAERAKEKLLKRMLRQLQRETKAWWKEEREVLYNEIDAEVSSRKVYKALNALRDRAGGIPRLDRQALIDQFGDDAVMNLPTGVTQHNGLHPDIAAELLGYKDAASLYAMLASAEPQKELTGALTDMEMMNRHGDIFNDGTLEQRAVEALENDDRTSALLYELRALARQTGGKQASRAAYEEAAAQRLEGMTLDDVISNVRSFYLAEVRSAREAGKALGRKNYAKAAEWKSKQLLNHTLYKQALELREGTQAALKRFKRYRKPLVKKKVTVDEDYHRMVNDLLDDWNFGPRMSEKRRGRLTREAIQAWMDERAQDDGAVFIPPVEIADEKTSYREMTVAEFGAFVDTVDNIWEQGRRLRQVLINGQKLDFVETRDALAGSILEHGEGKESPHETRGTLQNFKHLVNNYWTALIRPRTLLKKLDGWRYGGKAYEFLMADIDRAEPRRIDRLQQESQAIDRLFHEHFGGDRPSTRALRKKHFFPAINDSLTKEAAIVVALNWGNQTSRDRMLAGAEDRTVGHGWDQAQIDSILASLTQHDWEFVQATWDYLDTFWPEIAALEKRRSGITPARVQAVPFNITTADGVDMQLRGGYYPLKYDTRRDGKAPDDTSELLSSSFKGGHRTGAAHTSRGHNEVRKQNVKLSVRLDMKTLSSHVNQVVTDLTLGEPLDNAWRLLNSPKIAAAIQSRTNTETFKQLQFWLQDTAVGAAMADSAFESTLDSLRAGLSVSTMGFKVTTMMVQATGITHTLVQLGPGYTAKGLLRYLGGGGPVNIAKSVAAAFEMSNVLKQRATTMTRDVHDSLRKLEKTGGKWAAFANASYAPMVRTQLQVDLITWYGAHSQGLKLFDGDQIKAVEHADNVVVETQGSGTMKDLAGFERGSVSAGTRLSALVKLWTVFGSYFYTKLQLTYEKTATKGPHLSKWPGLAVDYAMLFWVEAIVGEMILARLPDDDDDEDAWSAWWNLKLALSSAAAMLPLVREIAGGASGFGAAPAGLRGLEAISTVTNDLTKAVHAAVDSDKDVDWWSTTRHIVSATGIVAKVPGTAQINQALRAMERESEGEDVTMLDYVRYRE